MSADEPTRESGGTVERSETPLSGYGINRRDLLKLAGASGAIASVGAAAAAADQIESIGQAPINEECEPDCGATPGPDTCGDCLPDCDYLGKDEGAFFDAEDLRCIGVDHEELDIPEETTHVALKAGTQCHVVMLTGEADQELCVPEGCQPSIGHVEYFACEEQICGKVFDDVELSGDPDQAGLEGWTVTLYDADDEPIADVVTDADGTYCFGDLEPGTYTVGFDLLEDWIQTYPEPSDPEEGDGVHEITLDEHETVADAHFGTVGPTSICGYKVEGDEIPEEPADAGLEGWTIELYDAEEELLESVDTDEDGAYCFDDLYPGTYVVREVLEEGWVQVYPAAGEHVIDLASGEPVDDAHFGNAEAAEICGVKFHDEAETGDPEDQELLDGWTIELHDGDGELVDAVVTGAGDFDEGAYCFDGVAPGEYVVSEVLEDGWMQTHPEGDVYDIEVAAGDEIEGIDFGNIEDEEEEEEVEGAPFGSGYWRNHSACTPGNQPPVLQDTLASANGITLGDLTLTDSEEDCPLAVNILAKRDVDGAMRASDGAYHLASSTFTALLNVEAGASPPSALGDAQAMLDDLGFDGTGSYLPPGPNAGEARQTARQLAGQLNDYNGEE